MASDVESELARLIAFPTVSNRPVTALAGHLAEQAEDLGFTIERFVDPSDAEKCTVIASIGPEVHDGLTISGHMDVVPTEGQPWQTDPFTLTASDGRLFGRGTADMKGFIAATMCALRSIDLGSLSKRLVLIWTHDEEVGCLGSAALVGALSGDPGWPRPTLIGEPTDFEILRMHPGHVVVDVTVRGLAAHSSRPHLGRNAIEGAAEVVAAARSLAAELQAEPADLPEMERPTVALNVGHIQGGSAINIVPDSCTLQIGYRPLPGSDPHAVFERLRAKTEALACADDLEWILRRTTPSMLTAAGTSLESALRPHASRPGTGACTFGTDGGNLAKVGLKPLVFGPGSIAVAHRANEYVAADALHRAVDVLADVIRRQCCRP